MKISMNSNKLILIKKIIEQELTSFDFNKEIEKNELMLSNLRETPADEYSLSGNIQYGIENIFEAVTGVTYPIGYLNAKKQTLEELLNLLDNTTEQLESIINPVSLKEDSTWKDNFLEKLGTKSKSKKKHFFDCTLTNEDWGSKNCICPGAYIYRKYLNIGLSEKEAKLISDYREFGDLMEDKEECVKGKELYQKHKFLNTKS